VKGLSIRHTATGIPVVRLHYSADPDRDLSWVKKERKKYTSQAHWDQEQEIAYGAGGGDLVLAMDLQVRLDEILVDLPDSLIDPDWFFGGGHDWGKTNPGPLLVLGVDFSGCIIALSECYVSHLQPFQHASLWSQLPLFNRISWIFSDPNIFNKDQAGERGEFQAISDLFVKAGIMNLAAGKAGGDLTTVEKILGMWTEGKEVMFKIRMPKLANGRWKYDFSKKVEGVYKDGCPNLVWELMNLRKARLTASQLLTQNPTESLVDQNNHGFDALKYFINSEPDQGRIGKEREWRQIVLEMKKKAPEGMVDINTLIWQRQRWEREQPKEVVKWAR